MAGTGKRQKKAKKAWSPTPYLFAAFRRVFRWSPERRKALEKVKCGTDLFRCENCSSLFDRSMVAVDHIDPVVDVKRGFEGWDAYAARLFCRADGLQVLCKKVCHATKTKAENAERRKYKAA